MSMAVSLFSGCGGCSLGLIQAGYSVSLAVELDEDACRTYRTNIIGGSPWQTDLRIVSPIDLLQHMRVGIEEVSLMTGGPPCQGFSSAGAKDWTDPRNSLLKKYVDFVVAIRPVWFVMENVEGLLTSNDGFFLTEAIAQFLKAGYWVRAKKVYLERYGLPQQRKRVIVVGNLEKCAFDFPEETHGDSESLFYRPTPLLSLTDAISDMTTAASDGEVLFTKTPQNEFQQEMRRKDNGPVTLHTFKKVNEVTANRIRHLKQGGSMKDLPKELQHPSFTRRAFRRVMDGTPSEKRGGAPVGLKRLVGSEPCLTITSAAPSEFVHPTEDRLLTLRECARIQSFPDQFAFSGSWSSVATQIGNAIPPRFMKLLGEHIKNMATWKANTTPRGRWLGMEATKSMGVSPALARMLTELKEKTNAYV